MQITHKIPNNHANGNSLTDSISYSVELMNKSEIQIKPAHISFYYYYFFFCSALHWSLGSFYFFCTPLTYVIVYEQKFHLKHIK